MLQLKHVTKVYHTKGGSDTKALDDVSLRFGETGLVFLLGKSGSGKSTLLNVAGGLDEPTSGEVIVRGKSSTSFSGNDFDSYRNTFVGFVFQEYNVLNEFNVEENVALALELQGRHKEKEKIDQILREVELENFAKRKPNTLSGGQKQRIAIARALVKDPQIIMADEPTGALDSTTGKQVFDTLKNLSKTRLVIVVSHDREFAEIYGDRIVELKDGKVISDVVKSSAPPVTVDSNVTVIGEDTISVKHGADLTAENLKQIKEFVSSCPTDVIITRGQTEVVNFKKANRIDENGAREVFCDTDEEAMNIPTYNGAETKFISSRLPLGKAIKIGASGLKVKPIRLFFTIFLSFVAFVMFGLASTMMYYKPDVVQKNTMMNSDYDYLMLCKNYRVEITTSYEGEEEHYTGQRDTRFTPAELAARTDAIGVFAGIAQPIGNVKVQEKYLAYYQPQISNLAFVPAGHALRSKITHGSYPTAANEICISSYLMDCIKNGTFTPLDATGQATSAPVTTPTEKNVIGSYLKISDRLFKVVGVFESGEIASKYDALLDNNSADFMTQFVYASYLDEGLHRCVFVADSFYQNYKGLVTGGDYVSYFNYTKSFQLKQGNSVVHNGNEAKLLSEAGQDQLPINYFDPAQNGLFDNQIVVGLGTIDTIFCNYFEANNMAAALEAWDVVVTNASGSYWGQSPETGEWCDIPVSKEVQDAAILQVIADFAKYGLSAEVTGDCSGNPMGDYVIVGFYTSPTGHVEDGIYCTSDFYSRVKYSYTDTYSEQTKYHLEPDATYNCLLVPFEKTDRGYAAIFDGLGVDHADEQTDIFYTVKNTLVSNVSTASELVAALSVVFLVIGIVLAVFSALLLFNFISVSISNKKREIGILRAVGARGTDVFKIFFSEATIIVGIATLLSIIGTLILTAVVNNALKTSVGLDVTLFVFGWLSLVTMLGIAAVVAVVATFLPVFFAARKKPVDSIRSL